MTELVLPRYGNGCVSDLMAHLLAPGVGGIDLGSPATADGHVAPTIAVAKQRVLFVLDGLGWHQLTDRWHLAPTMAAMAGGPITTVAPSTTATALTSITTSLTPGEHGVVGYRMMIDGDVLNTLRWSTERRPDARATIPPDVLQPYPPFQGLRTSMVTKAEFAKSGFTMAHLRGGRLAGYRTPATLVHEVVSEIQKGEPVVYAYWDGIDKVAHEYGLNSVYDSEIVFADRLVAAIIDALPAGVEVLVTADHGQVDCTNGLVEIDADVLANTADMSGEGRFRWLHSSGMPAAELAALVEAAHGDVSWIRTFEQIADENWFGPTVTPDARDRLGDVALVPFEPIAFADPDDTGPFDLIGRHGSLTPEEMYVPLLQAIT
ncbi:MAG: alkaline phosphatase family protein [Acidimicrobiales bacterium]